MVGIEKSAIHADAKLPEHQDDKTYQLKTSEEIRKAIFPDGIPAQPQEDGGDNVPVGAEAKEAFGISVELTGEGVAGALIKAGLRLGDKNGATFTIKEKRKLDDGTIGLEFFMKQFQGVNLDPLNVPGGKGFVKIEDVTFEQSTQLSEVDKQKKWTVLITKKDGKFAMHIAPMKEGFEPSAKLTVTGKGPKDLTVSLAPDGKKLIFKDKAGTVVTEASLENVQVVGSTATQYIYVQNKRWQLDLKNAKNQLEVKITPVEWLTLHPESIIQKRDKVNRTFSLEDERVKLKIANLPAVSLVETQKLANPNDTIVLKQSFATPGGTKFYRIELRNDLGAIRVMGITEKNSIEETDTLPKRDEDGGKVFYYNEDGEIVSAEAGTWLFGLKDNILHVYDYALSSEEGKDPTYTSITKIDLSWYPDLLTPGKEVHLLEPIRHEDKIFEAILTNTEEGMQIQLQEVTIGFVGAESKLEVTNAHLLSGSANRKVEYDPATQKIRIVDGTQTVTDRIDIQEAREFDATVDTQVVAWNRAVRFHIENKSGIVKVRAEVLDKQLLGIDYDIREQAGITWQWVIQEITTEEFTKPLKEGGTSVVVVISPLTFGSEKKYEFTAVFTRQEVGQLNVRGYKSEKKELTAPDGSSYILQAENRNDYLTFTVTPGKPPKQPETTEHGGKKPDVYYFKGDRALYPTLKLKDPIKVGNVEITEIQIASFQRTPVTYKGQKVLSTEEKARVDLLYLSEKGLLTDPLGKLQKFGLWINKGFLQFLWLGIDLSKMQHISSTNTTPPVHTFEATIVGERGDHDPWKISLIVAPGKVGNEMRVELIEVPEAFFDPKEIKKEALLGDLDRDTPFAHIDYPTWMSELSDKLWGGLAAMAEYFSSRTKEDVAEVSRKVGFIDDKETLGLGMAWPVDDDYKPSITTGDYKLDIESDDPNVEAALSYKTDFGWRIYKSKEIQLHAGLDISVPDDENVDVSSVLDDGLIYEIKDGKDGAVIVDYPKSVLHVRWKECYVRTRYYHVDTKYTTKDLKRKVGDEVNKEDKVTRVPKWSNNHLHLEMYLVDASTGKVVIRPYTLNKSRVPEEYQKYKVTGTDHQEVAGNTVKTGTVDPTRFFTENQTGLKFWPDNLGNIPDVFNVEDAVKEKISTKQKENLATANTQYSTFKKRVEINKTADKDLLNVVTPAAMKALFWLETWYGIAESDDNHIGWFQVNKKGGENIFAELDAGRSYYKDLDGLIRKEICWGKSLKECEKDEKVFEDKKKNTLIGLCMMYSKAKADKQGKNKELDEVIDDLNKYKDEAEAYAKERGVEIDDDRLDDLINTIKKGGTKASQYRMICRYNAEWRWTSDKKHAYKALVTMYVAAYHQEFTVDETKDASTKPKKKETPKSTERKDEYEAESKQAGVSLSSTVRGKTNVFGANFYQNRLEGNSYTRGGYRITPKGEYLYLISKDYEAVKLDPTTFKNEKATITLNGKQYTISYELVWGKRIIFKVE